MEAFPDSSSHDIKSYDGDDEEIKSSPDFAKIEVLK
jgi:hypothetical protein